LGLIYRIAVGQSDPHDEDDDCKIDGRSADGAVGMT